MASAQVPRTATSYVKNAPFACGIAPSRNSYGGTFDETLISDSSGFDELDLHIAEELNALNTFFALSPKGRPTFSFYDDTVRPFGAKTLRISDNSTRVLLGLSLIRAEISQNTTTWQSSIIGIMAHEWGHVLQYRTGLDDPQINLELHADYMSGFYIGLKTIFGLNPSKSTFEHALYIRGRSKYFSDINYGTPDQRVRAMRSGFDDAESHFSTYSRIDTIAVGLVANRGYDYLRVASNE